MIKVWICGVLVDIKLKIGILTYEMLTGKVPFEHKQRKIVMQKIVNVRYVINQVDKDKIIYP